MLQDAMMRKTQVKIQKRKLILTKDHWIEERYQPDL